MKEAPPDTPDRDQKGIEVALKDFIFIREDQLLLKVSTQDVLFVKSDANYIEIHLTDKKYVVRGKLSDFANRVVSIPFSKVHQRYLVNLKRIDSIGRSYVMIDEHKIPVSKSHYSKLVSSILIIP